MYTGYIFYNPILKRDTGGLEETPEAAGNNKWVDDDKKVKYLTLPTGR